MLGGVVSTVALIFLSRLQLSFYATTENVSSFFFCFFLLYLTALAFTSSLAIICPREQESPEEEIHRLRLLPEGHPDQQPRMLESRLTQPVSASPSVF